MKRGTKFLKIEQLQSLVKERLSEKRYFHTLAVVKLSVELAERYNISADDARVAAILHDITKEDDVAVQLQTMKKSDIIFDVVFEKNANLYHGLTAFLYARDILKIQNCEVLNAIRYHTTGRANMSMLEKIVFVADAVAYDRNYANVSLLRKLSFEEIDKAMLEIIEFTISSLLKKRQLVAIDMLYCYNQLLLQQEKQMNQRQQERAE